jgi:hypothetical protein
MNVLGGAAFSMYELLPGDLLGYLEVSGKVGVERSFWASAVHVALLGKVQFDQPFLYYYTPDTPITPVPPLSGYRSVTIPLVELAGSLDKRIYEKDVPLSPHEGVYVSAGVQVAAGSTTQDQDVRVRSEVRGYVPIAHRWTLAVRLGGGLLHAFGGPLAGPSPAPIGECHDPTCARFLQLMQLRGFQSGGSESNRGYPYGGIGPHEPVPIPSPRVEPYSQLQGGRLTSTGGSAIWEASADLRFPIFGALGGAVFVDGSDVWRVDLPYTFAPHLSPGIELRVLTPFGVLRGDFAVRVPGAQVLGSSCQVYDPTGAYGGPNHTCAPGNAVSPAPHDYLDPKYGLAGTVANQPFALSISFGEAF